MARFNSVDAAPSVGWFAQPGAPMRTVAGRVTFEGAPVAGATVRVSSRASEAGAMPVRETLTPASGAFAFQDLPPGANYIVSATAPGRTSAAVRLDMRGPNTKPAPEHLELVLTACDVTLSGLILDASGGPIPGATVKVDSHDNATSVTANQEGRYEICVAPGEIWLRAGAAGYGQATANIQVLGRTRHDLALVPEVVISGRVVMAEDGAPIAGALVEAMAAEFSLNSHWALATSDADGRFQMSGLGPGRYHLRARASGRGGREPVEVVTRVGEAPVDSELRLEPFLVVRGTVVAGEVPVAGVEVTVSGSSRDYNASSAVTQADGSFAIDALPPGRVRFRVARHTLVDPKEEHELSASNTSVVVRVETMATIRGRVTRKGAAIARADVSASGPAGGAAYGKTNTDGTFELEGLLPGVYQIGADSKHAGAFARPREIVVTKGQRQDGVNIELDLAGSVAGVVVDEQGAPVPGVAVRLSLVAGADYGADVTAEDGTFVARSLSGGGAYTFDVRPSAESAISFTLVEGSTKTVDVRDGDTHITGLRITIRHERLVIEGRVLRDSGAPVPDAAVLATVASADTRADQFLETAAAKTTTGADGSFVLEGLVTGTYILRARTGTGIRAELVDVAAGRKDVVISLADAGGIEGTLVGFSGAPTIVAYPGTGPSYRATVEQDRFVLQDLAPGTYVVSATYGAEGDTTTAKVVAGQKSQVTLRSKGRARVTGTFIDFHARTPVAGYDCRWRLWSADRAERYFAATAAETVSTDSKGRFAIDVPASKRVAIDCSSRKSGIEGIEPAIVEVEAGAAADVTVLRVARQREQTGRGYIGAELGHDPPTVVLRVAAGGPAETAGLAQGDVIVEVDGLAVEALSGTAAEVLLLDRKIGETAHVTVLRGAARKALGIVISVRPSNAAPRDR